MVDDRKKTLLSQVKAATLGIGVVTMKMDNPKKVDEVDVHGTGFFLNDTGYVMTASHVIYSCLRVLEKKIKIEKRNAGLIAIQLRFLPNGGFKYSFIPMQNPYFVNIGRASQVQGSSLPLRGIDVDVAVFYPNEKKEVINTPFLQIKEKESLIKPYDHVAMCGFPSGKNSLNVSMGVITLRLSPVMQFGVVAGLLPTDNAVYPYGIQTDIIGTGGSSGSPIIDLESGEVIAIAQNVLATSVGGEAVFQSNDNPEKELKGKLFAMSKIGLVYGISHHILHGIPEGVRDEIKYKKPYRDPPKISLFQNEGMEEGYTP
jgi:hypothetical protein